MTHLPILPVTSWTALFGAVLIAILTIHVVRLRRKDGVVLGDAGNRVLAKAIRGHANAAEQLPIALIILALAEANGAPSGALIAVAGVLGVGRLMHAAYFAIHGLTWRLRFYGMWLTFLAQVGLITLLFWQLVT